MRSKKEAISSLEMNSTEGYEKKALITAIILGGAFLCGEELRIAGFLAVLASPLMKRMGVTKALPFLLIVLFLYPVFIVLLQGAYWRNGVQGVDFGIFSQVIFQIATQNQFSTSLTGFNWQNFLTHHFSLYLYPLGLIRRLGIPSPIILIVAHGGAVCALVAGVYKVYSALSDRTTKTVLLTAAAVLLPAVRIGLSWETHDEVLALPFLVWSLYAHLTGKEYLKVILLLPPLLFKETLGLNVLGFSIFYLLDRPSHRFLLLSTGLLGGAVFLLYTQVFPHWLWTPTFEPTARLSSVNQFFTKEALVGKAVWLAKTGLPLLPFLFLHSWNSFVRSCLLCVGIFYNYAAIILTNFPNMYDPYNYYSVTTSLVTFLAFSSPVINNKRCIQAIFYSLLLLSLIGPGMNARQTFLKAVVSPSAYSELKEQNLEGKLIVADDRTTSVLSESREIKRLFHAKNQSLPFDVIVLRKERSQALSRTLSLASVPCGETPRYIIRCRKPA